MKRNRLTISNGIFYLILTAYAGISLYPFLWMASSAFKSNEEVLTSQSLIPQAFRLDIIGDVWSRLDFWKYTLNSAIVSVAVVIGIVVVYSLAGYGFAKTSFRGREYFFYGFLAMLLVPSVTVLIPLVQELKAFGLIGRDSNQFLTYVGLILPIINGGGPFAVFL